MKTAHKEVVKRPGVSKKEFERAYVELSDRLRIIDQRLSTKADDIVLTMTLAHRNEIDELQTEVIKLREELNKVKPKPIDTGQFSFKSQKRSPSVFRNLFKRMQIARK
ncbi:hypothetical protein [Sediminibacillus massiliensis]|uniref:hypothetical protein n=1 Tax=Sediminibacillus massiliensis TaxID=1926277 RepID=UPI0009886A9C|nr:hypothetical protein [Sediminibacillus massiliensis]